MSNFTGGLKKTLPVQGSSSSDLNKFRKSNTFFNYKQPIPTKPNVHTDSNFFVTPTKIDEEDELHGKIHNRTSEKNPHSLKKIVKTGSSDGCKSEESKSKSREDIDCSMNSSQGMGTPHKLNLLLMQASSSASPKNNSKKDMKMSFAFMGNSDPKKDYLGKIEDNYEDGRVQSLKAINERQENKCKKIMMIPADHKKEEVKNPLFWNTKKNEEIKQQSRKSTAENIAVIKPSIKKYANFLLPSKKKSTRSSFYKLGDEENSEEQCNNEQNPEEDTTNVRPTIVEGGLAPLTDNSNKKFGVSA